jgi:hypothetical protein
MPLHPHSTPAPSGSDPPKPKANDDEKIFPAFRLSTEETPKALVVKEQFIDLSIAPKGKFNANLGKANHILEWFSLGRFIWEVSRSTPHHLQVIAVYFQNHFR